MARCRGVVPSLLCLLGLTAALPAAASVVIAGTRVIYRAAEPEVTLKLSNDGKTPSLLESWIDDGDATATPTNAKAPFTITPPLARIDPTKSQTLRITYVPDPAKALPQDRESLFYFNVLEVPPKPVDTPATAGSSPAAASSSGAPARRNWLQLAIRSRLKLFYRPAGVKGTVQEALPQLTWHLGREAGHAVLIVRNPSPYYVTFNQVALRSGGREVKATLGTHDMLAPGAQQALPLESEPPAAAQVHVQILNDLGGLSEADRPLSP